MTTPAVAIAVFGTLLAAALTAAEAAINRMSRVRAQELAAEGRVGSAALRTVMSDPAPHLATLAFLRIIAETAVAVLITVLVMGMTETTEAAVLISIAVLAVITFVVVGVSPRTLGRQHFDTVARLSAPTTRVLRIVLGPVSRGLVALGNAVTPGRGYREGPFQSESELRDLLDQASERQMIEDDEREMLDSVFELGDTVAREVMVPRIDMVTLDVDEPLRKAMSLFLRTGISRMPVVGEDSDDVRGLLYFKDVVERVTADPDGAALPVTILMRPMPFVPESKPVDDLLREMQRGQQHFAIVVDEYGGTAGLVTIEDIIEEIVGDIADEHDRDEPGVEALPDGGYRVPASLNLHDMGDLFDLDLQESEVDTVGGLLTKALGRIPYAGDVASVAGLTLNAERMSGRRHRLATVVVARQAPVTVAEERAPAVTPAAVLTALSEAVTGPSPSSDGTELPSDDTEETP
ncbi:MAG: HlyC/CorC family transporter [Actinomycetales bacterium]|nr:HlyC/CorC family transporter [Actinomycetales bacterium]